MPNQPQPTGGTLTPDQISAFDQASGLKTAPNANPQAVGAVQSRVAQLQTLAKGVPDPTPNNNVVSKIIDDTNQHAAKIVDDLSQKPNLTGAIDVGGEVAREAGDIISEPLKPLLNSDNKNGGLPAVMKDVAGTPVAQALIKAWNGFEAQHPDLAKSIGNVLDIGALFGGNEISPTAEEAVAGAKQGAKVVGDTIAEAPAKIAESAKTVVQAPLNAAQHLATPIDQNVMTVLKNPTAETEGTLKNMFTQAKAAVAGPEASPFEAVGKSRLGGSLDALNEKMSAAGVAKDEALKRVGARDVTAGAQDVAKDFYSNLESRLGTTVNGEGKLEDAAGRSSLVANSPGDAKLIKQVDDLFTKISDPKENGMSIQKVNDAIDSIQNNIFNSHKMGAEPISTKTEGILKQTIGKLNAVVKDAATEIGPKGEKINPYAQANETYARLKPLHEDLSNRLGQNMKNAGSIVKRIFSPQDGGTKDLIRSLEKETGQPIFHDATLAKFAMDAVGDPRAKSLLEEGMNAKSKGFIKTGLDYIQKKLENPEGKATQIIRRARAKK